MKQNPVNFPQVLKWLARIAADDSLSLVLLNDPIVFASWYSMAHDIFEWPEDVKAIQSAERAKKISLERMSSLLSKINYVTHDKITSAAARMVLEGYAVHEWVVKNSGAFGAMAKVRLDFIEDLVKRVSERPVDAHARLMEVAEAFDLSDLETDILTFSILVQCAHDFANIFYLLTSDPWFERVIWPIVFRVSREELALALAPRSPLRLSGLLNRTDMRGKFAAVPEYIAEILVKAEGDLLAELVEPVNFKAGSGVPARLEQVDFDVAEQILKKEGEAGVNLFLYGPSVLDKRDMLSKLVSSAGRTAYQLVESEVPWTSLPVVALLAQRLLAEIDDDPVLVISDPSQVLRAGPTDFIRRLFGIDVSSNDATPFDEHMLSTNMVPTIWTGSSGRALPDDTLARFVFHAPLKKISKEDRRAHVETLVENLNLSEKVREEILKFEGLSATQIASATRAADLMGVDGKREHDEALLQAIKRSQRALSRDLNEKGKESVTEYSTRYLNTAGRFKPDDILAALGRSGRGSLCFYGPPGTGKTQFAEHLAKQLGRPLLIKRASDLLSKWLGEAEQNIAKMFEEAAAEESILLLDEGDSFLRDRSRAERSWEVTQVNELLQHMERFNGIFILCTNLFKGLDAAAMRRFNFKIQFHPLNANQRWEMFVNEAGLKEKVAALSPEKHEEYMDALAFMPNLAAGDFAVVKQQCIIMDVQLTPEQWIEQLKIEVAIKSGDVPEEMAALV